MITTIDPIIHELKKHGVSSEKVKEVYDAYIVAARIHKGVPRESGEPYITHPLNVANNLLKWEIYDTDAVAAALLHDTIEDAHFKYEKEHIAQSFNPTIATLVEGVTKLKGMEFTNKEEKNAANTRKLITAAHGDIRIIYIKLGDRDHNMRTISWKSPQKQKENAAETLEIHVPMAIKVGLYQGKNDLEDLSLKCIDPVAYALIEERVATIIQQQRPALERMADRIHTELNKKGIKNSIVFRQKSINNIYKEINNEHKKIENIYDIFYFKILVENEDECYIALGVVNRLYTPVNERFKDYFSNPRGFYQSLHTTNLDDEGNERKIKIRTEKMDKRDAYGLIADLNMGRSMEDIQKEFREKWFDKKFQEIDATYEDNKEFVKALKADLFSDEIYVYGSKGGITIPKGSTALDFACEVYSADELKELTSIVVNGVEVPEPFNQELKNNDTVKVILNGKLDESDWSKSVTTEKAKLMIKKMKEKDNAE